MTKSGASVAGIGATLLAAAWLTAYPELLLLATACFASCAAAAVTVHPPQVSAAVRPRVTRASRDANASVRIEVHNEGRRSVRWLSCRIAAHPAKDYGQLDVAHLSPQETLTAWSRLDTSRRGVLDLSRVEVNRTDVFGLIRRSRISHETAIAYIHPPVAEFFPSRRSRIPHQGRLATPDVGHDASDIHALRPYVAGDDRRAVHWRSSARLGTLVVRQNVESAIPAAALVLDTRSASYPGRRESDPAINPAFEAAVEVVAAVGVALLARGYGLFLQTTAGSHLTNPRARDGRERLLDLLSAAAIDRQGDLMASLRAVRLRCRSAGTATLIVVSGTRDAGQASAARTVRAGWGSVALVRLGTPPHDETSSGQARPGELMIDAQEASKALAALCVPPYGSHRTGTG